MPRATSAVGRNVLRKEGASKVSGAAKYIDDLSFPGLLHPPTIRSTIPAGEIAGIGFNFDTAGFTIVDFRDVPGRNIVALIEDDQPCLAERAIRHFAEPIVLLAHQDRETLLAAEVQIDYREATPLYDYEASPAGVKKIRIGKGRGAGGFPHADVIVAGDHPRGHQEHPSIDTHRRLAPPS